MIWEFDIIYENNKQQCELKEVNDQLIDISFDSNGPALDPDYTLFIFFFERPQIDHFLVDNNQIV